MKKDALLEQAKCSALRESPWALKWDGNRNGYRRELIIRFLRFVSALSSDIARDVGFLVPDDAPATCIVSLWFSEVFDYNLEAKRKWLLKWLAPYELDALIELSAFFANLDHESLDSIRIDCLADSSIGKSIITKVQQVRLVFGHS